MQHFVTEMCTHVHISVTKYCIVGYDTGALWDLWDRSIRQRYLLPHVCTLPQIGLATLDGQIVDSGIAVESEMRAALKIHGAQT